mmetsp:Transcript_71984/g.64677  ORF Transcript_71984/g.64677 Transcript_71984/m.64677 type:complete len:123 (-) Transcript_71984:194-562(-)
MSNYYQYNNMTWVADSSGNVYVGNYKRSGGLTQHRRLADYTGIGYVGGSINFSRSDYVGGIGYNSRTLNIPSTGNRSVAGTDIGIAAGTNILKGSVYKAYNMGGGMGRVHYNSVTDDLKVLY